MTKYIMILVGMTLFTASCSTPNETIVTKEVPVEKIPLNLEMPRSFAWKDFGVIVVTKDNYEEVFEKLHNDGKAASLFAFDEDGYEALSLNVAEMKRYMQEQKVIILQYKNYYENNNNN